MTGVQCRCSARDRRGCDEASQDGRDDPPISQSRGIIRVEGHRAAGPDDPDDGEGEIDADEVLESRTHVRMILEKIGHAST